MIQQQKQKDQGKTYNEIGDAVQGIRERMQHEFWEIGLSINMEKCSTTYIPNVNYCNQAQLSSYYDNNRQAKHEIVFMGTTYSILNRQQPIAPGLLQNLIKELEQLNKMLEAKIDRNIIYQIFVKSSLAQVNYGPFIDTENQLETYQEIDKEIVKFFRKLGEISIEITDKEIQQFLVSSNDNEGLQLLLPGEYFKMMNTVSYCPMEKISEAFVVYHENREKFLKEGSQPKDSICIAIHAFKNFYNLLEDDEFLSAFQNLSYHSSHQFQKFQEIMKERNKYSTQEPSGLCPHCKRIINKDHDLKCVVLNKIKISQHNGVQALIKYNTRKIFTVLQCETAQNLANKNNIPYADPQNLIFKETEYEFNKKQADFQIPELQRAYDVTIREPDQLKAAVKCKKAKYSKVYYGNEVIPLAMSLNATVYQESLDALFKITNKNTLLPKLAARLLRCSFERQNAFKEATRKQSEDAENYYIKQCKATNTLSFHETQKAIELNNSIDVNVQKQNQTSIELKRQAKKQNKQNEEIIAQQGNNQIKITSDSNLNKQNGSNLQASTSSSDTQGQVSQDMVEFLPSQTITFLGDGNK